MLARRVALFQRHRCQPRFLVAITWTLRLQAPILCFPLGFRRPDHWVSRLILESTTSEVQKQRREALRG